MIADIDINFLIGTLEYIEFALSEASIDGRRSPECKRIIMLKDYLKQLKGNESETKDIWDLM